MAVLEVLVFGQLTDSIGGDRIHLSYVQDTDLFRTAMNERFPGLRDKTFLLAVNQELVLGKRILNPGDTVALLPPFSGG
ncbi:MAG: MoaD/ThiS family protein [Bacteroidetes bacterium]|nr:MoaD/ThiS family protein [Bacteroidota bacterium]MSP58433.1 MoaD/ThiS family protein [Flavobacteriaceae bacterium]PHX92306.1 MAG: molybdopterin synthase sulfur carrier subunit [Flavobacteriales bacterium]